MLWDRSYDQVFLANGIPRCGTHLLVSALRTAGFRWEPTAKLKWFPGRHERLGHSLSELRTWQRKGRIAPHTFVHGHVSWPFAELPTVTIVRDPRAAIVACARAFDLSDNLSRVMRYYGEPRASVRGMDFVTVFRAFEPWLEDRVVRFEDLDTGRLAGFRKITGCNARFDEYWGMSESFLPDRPDWHDVFTDEDWGTFRRLGGEQLVKDFGYGL